MGEAMSMVATGIILGVTAGPPIGGILYGVGEAVPFLFMVILIGVAAFFAVLLQKGKYGSLTKNWRAAFGNDPVDSSPQSGETMAPVKKETKEEFRAKAVALLTDRNIVVTLFSLFCVNAAISCLESTFGRYMSEEFGFSVEQTGMLYVLGAFPSVVGSKVSGGLGNKYGRWKVVMIGEREGGGRA